MKEYRETCCPRSSGWSWHAGPYGIPLFGNLQVSLLPYALHRWGQCYHIFYFIFPILVKEQTFRDTFFSLLSGGDLFSNYFERILSNPAEPNYLLFKTNSSYEICDIMKRLFLEQFRYDKYVNRCSIYWLNLLFTNILRNSIWRICK